VTAFIGPNGAGKTTTIRAVLGLVHPDAGSTAVFGAPFTDLKHPMSRVGALIDGSGFHPLRSGRNHLRMVAASGGIPRGRVDEVLDLVELADAAQRRVGGYSLGMRQRLGLATALLGDPDLLILDEPANGLDPAGIRWLRSFLESYASSGRTVFVSSHLLSEVALVAEEVIVINRGTLVEQTTVDQLTGGSAVVVRSPDWERLRAALLARGASVSADADHALRVVGLTVEDVGAIANHERAVLHHLSTDSSTLEEIFLELTSSKELNNATAA
jgi:ABC-2 type transport system ATP-binding protein